MGSFGWLVLKLKFRTHAHNANGKWLGTFEKKLWKSIYSCNNCAVSVTVTWWLFTWCWLIFLVLRRILSSSFYTLKATQFVGREMKVPKTGSKSVIKLSECGRCNSQASSLPQGGGLPLQGSSLSTNIVAYAVRIIICPATRLHYSIRLTEECVHSLLSLHFRADLGYVGMATIQH